MKATIANDDPRFKTLDRLHSAKPFKEFDLVTTDGRRLHIDKWYEITFDESGVVVANEKKSGLYRLPWDNVQSVEEPEEKLAS